MKHLRLLALLLLTSCSTTLYSNSGKPLMRSYADTQRLHYANTQQGITFDMDAVSHSRPTRAAGSVVGTASSGLASIIAAWITGGAVK